MRRTSKGPKPWVEAAGLEASKDRGRRAPDVVEQADEPVRAHSNTPTDKPGGGFRVSGTVASPLSMPRPLVSTSHLACVTRVTYGETDRRCNPLTISAVPPCPDARR